MSQFDTQPTQAERDELELLKLEEEEHQHQEMLKQQASGASNISANTLPKPDVSYVESAARAATQGLTFNNEDELAGLVGAGVKGGQTLLKGEIPSLAALKPTYEKYRDIERNANHNAQQANPLTYAASEIASGFVPGLGFANKAYKVAKGASTLAKFVNAGNNIARGTVIGTGVGGLSGFGASEATTPDQLLQDTGEGMKFGAAVGGTLSSAPEALNAAKIPIEKAYNLASKFRPVKIIGESVRKGFQGNNLTDLEAQFGKLNNLVNELGDKGLGLKQELSGEYDALKNALSQSKETVDLGPTLERLKDIEAKYRGIKSPEVHADLDNVNDVLHNYTQGMPQEIQESVVVPGKVSGSEKAQQDLALRKAQLEAQGHQAVDSSLEHSTDDLGRPIAIPRLNYVDANQENAVEKVLRPKVDTPATQDSERIKKSIQRLGGSEQLTPRELFDLQKLINNKANIQSTNLSTNQGIGYAGDVKKALQSTTNEALPGLQNLDERYSNMKRALDVFGLDANESFIKNGKTGELELAPGVLNKIQNYIRNAGGENAPKNAAAQALNLFLDNAEAAGLKNTDQLRNTIKSVGENFELSRTIAGKDLYSQTGLPGLNVKNTAFLGNLAGLGAGKVANQVEHATEFMRPGETSIINAHEDQKGTGKFSRDLYNLNNDQLASVGDYLVKNGDKHGKDLQQAVQSKDKNKVNRLLFLMLQNPDTKKLLRGE